MSAITNTEDQDEPRCPAILGVKMPYDSLPMIVKLQCRRSEAECDGEHDFEYIPGATYPKGARRDY
jgi:hypothetical protein